MLGTSDDGTVCAEAVSSDRGAVPSDGLLSVVMTARDVEEYVGEAVSSVLDQSYRDLELVVVDDGSADGTAGVLAELASHDPRVRLLRADGVGPGAARNLALREVGGELLTFVDGDDVVPQGAFAALVGALGSQDADIAVGDVVRLHDHGLGPSPAHERSVRRRHERTHIDAVPDLVYDSTAWNKVYRRRLWTDHRLHFTEGAMYEDIAVVLEAHVRASAVTILGEVTYHWRWRRDSSSITQLKGQEQNLRDRVRALDHSLHLTENHPELRAALLAKIRRFDLLLYAYHAEVARDRSYRKLYRAAVRQFVPVRDAVLAPDLAVEDRLAYLAVHAGAFSVIQPMRRLVRSSRDGISSTRGTVRRAVGHGRANLRRARRRPG